MTAQLLCPWCDGLLSAPVMEVPGAYVSTCFHCGWEEQPIKREMQTILRSRAIERYKGEKVVYIIEVQRTVLETYEISAGNRNTAQMVALEGRVDPFSHDVLQEAVLSIDEKTMAA